MIKCNIGPQGLTDETNIDVVTAPGLSRHQGKHATVESITFYICLFIVRFTLLLLDIYFDCLLNK